MHAHEGKFRMQNYVFHKAVEAEAAKAALLGCQMIQADRDIRSSGKSKGGGVAVLVSNRWFNPGHVTVKERICTWDTELLSGSLHPYHLPREFTCVILVVVYILTIQHCSRPCL